MTKLKAFDLWQYHDEDGNLDLGHAWAPPSSLTVAALKTLDAPDLWLADVINLMAFGERAELTTFGVFDTILISTRKEILNSTIFYIASGRRALFSMPCVTGR